MASEVRFKGSILFFQFYGIFRKIWQKIYDCHLFPEVGTPPTRYSGSAIVYGTKLYADITLKCFSSRIIPSLFFVQKYKTVRQ